MQKITYFINKNFNFTRPKFYILNFKIYFILKYFRYFSCSGILQIDDEKF